MKFLELLSASIREFETLTRGKVIAERINIRGCVTATRTILNQDVWPLLVGWISIGCVLLLADILAILISVTKLFNLTSRETGTKKGSEEMPLRYTSTISLTLSKNHL